jgi:hypothetical protein
MFSENRGSGRTMASGQETHWAANFAGAFTPD